MKGTKEKGVLMMYVRNLGVVATAAALAAVVCLALPALFSARSDVAVLVGLMIMGLLIAGGMTWFAR